MWTDWKTPAFCVLLMVRFTWMHLFFKLIKWINSIGCKLYFNEVEYKNIVIQWFHYFYWVWRPLNCVILLKNGHIHGMHMMPQSISHMCSCIPVYDVWNMNWQEKNLGQRMDLKAKAIGIRILVLSVIIRFVKKNVHSFLHLKAEG